MSLSDGRLWFIFGEHQDGVHVDIADGENASLFVDLPRELALRICDEHNAVVFAIEDEAYTREARQREATHG